MKIDNTIEIEALVYSLSQLICAQQEHDNARDEYIESGGYSWGYYGRDYVNRIESCAKEFGARLNKIIDDKVKAVLETA